MRTTFYAILAAVAFVASTNAVQIAGGAKRQCAAVDNLDRAASTKQNQEADKTAYLAGNHDDEVVAHTTPEEIFKKRCPKKQVLKAGKKYKNGPPRICDGAADIRDISVSYDHYKVDVDMVYMDRCGEKNLERGSEEWLARNPKAVAETAAKDDAAAAATTAKVKADMKAKTAK